MQGWEPEGENCVRMGSVPAVSSKHEVYNEVPAEPYCPKGYENAGKRCEKTEYAKRVPSHRVTHVPEKFCPPGTKASKTGNTCEVKRKVKHHSVVEKPKTVKAQRAAKTPEAVNVEQPTSVLTHTCPKGATPVGGEKKGGPEVCEVLSELPAYVRAWVNPSLLTGCFMLCFFLFAILCFL
jgi:hypothetical protein